jgi:hypothetical protein
MKRFLLDTSALLTLRDDEEGADQVADLLQKAEAGRAHCFACFIKQMEVFYRVWKDEGGVPGTADLMGTRRQGPAGKSRGDQGHQPALPGQRLDCGFCHPE